MDDLCGWLGQNVSFEKFMAYISANVKFEVARGIPLTNNLGKYIGMPTIHGRVTQNTFKFILDKVYSRLLGCKAKFLSLTLRAALIKSIIFCHPYVYHVRTRHFVQS